MVGVVSSSVLEVGPPPTVSRPCTPKPLYCCSHGFAAGGKALAAGRRHAFGAVVPCHAMLCHTIPYHARTIPYHAILYSYHTVLYHTVLYHTIPYHTIPYHTTPCHTIPYHTISYCTVPYHTVPYRTIPYHTIPYHTKPYHAISRLIPLLTIRGVPRALATGETSSRQLHPAGLVFRRGVVQVMCKYRIPLASCSVE